MKVTSPTGQLLCSVIGKERCELKHLWVWCQICYLRRSPLHHIVPHLLHLWDRYNKASPWGCSKEMSTTYKHSLNICLTSQWYYIRIAASRKSKNWHLKNYDCILAFMSYRKIITLIYSGCYEPWWHDDNRSTLGLRSSHSLWIEMFHDPGQCGHLTSLWCERRKWWFLLY